MDRCFEGLGWPSIRAWPYKGPWPTEWTGIAMMISTANPTPGRSAHNLVHKSTRMYTISRVLAMEVARRLSGEKNTQKKKLEKIVII